MLDAVHSEAVSPRIPGLRDENDLLWLSPGAGLHVVYVKDLGDGRAGFGNTELGPFHCAGVQWSPDSKNRHDLFITFVLMTGITEIARSAIAPTIFLSAPFPYRSHVLQDGCAPMVSQKTTYHFCVDIAGRLYDPKIVVTPT
jgi:hypothetical protein